MEIRELRDSDSEAIQSLMNELGYSTGQLNVLEMIQLVQTDAWMQLAFGVEINNELVGFIHAQVCHRFTTASFIEIVALVIGANHRRKGLGTELVKKIKEKAKEKVMNVRVRCNVRREEAHLFYQKLGFDKSKEQKVFICLV